MQIEGALSQRNALGSVDGQLDGADMTVHLDGGRACVGVVLGTDLQQTTLRDEYDLSLQVQRGAFFKVQSTSCGITYRKFIQQSYDQAAQTNL